MGGLELEAGAVIGDGRCAYRLARLIGEGGMGYVWQATHESSGKPFALKILKGGKAEDRRRFQREVRAAAAIHHPNVITVHEFIELPNGVLVIVMDLLEGETLGAIVVRDERLSLADLSTVLLPVLSALEAAHELGIIHRDLKPDNVFLSRTASDSAHLDVKVLDFGVAKLTADDGLAAQTQALTSTGSMVGTPYYMSPEQVFADKDLDARADIWSLGVIMYECLTGVRPTEADTVGRVLKRIMVADIEPVTKHCPDLPEDVASLIGRMLSVDREKRPQSLGDVRSVLERHKGDRLPSFSSAGPSPRVDPHAATVPTPEQAPRVASSAPAAAPVVNPSLAGTDTSDPVSVAARHPSPGRKRLVAALSLVSIAGVGGTIFVRGTSARENGASATVAPRASTAPSASAPTPKESSIAAVPSATATAEGSASAVTAAPVAPSPRVAPVTSTRPASVRAPAAALVDAGTAVAPAASCEAREVLSNGHCCPRGLVWQFGRCERPFATTF